MSIILLQTAAENYPDFDFSIVWRTVRGLGEGFLARLPYLIIALIVFGVFLIVARIIMRVVHAAGERTRACSGVTFARRRRDARRGVKT